MEIFIAIAIALGALVVGVVILALISRRQLDSTTFDRIVFHSDVASGNPGVGRHSGRYES